MLSIYLDELKSIPLLEHKEHVELFKALKASETTLEEAAAIKNKLVECNLRLVVSIAKRYRRSKLPFEDLIQEGNLGLIKSIDMFDWTKGFRFGTYASWWIRQAIGQFVMNRRNIVRLPAHASALQRKIMSATETFMGEHDRAPTPTELMEATGASDTVMRATINAGFGSVSLSDNTHNRSGGSSDGYTFESTIAASGPDVNPFENVSILESKEIIRNVLSLLSRKEMTILRLRFALVDGIDEQDDTNYDITEEELEAIKNGDGLK